MIILTILLLFAHHISAQDESILCSARTCSDYITATPCPKLPENCKIQNATHNGLMLPYPDPCDCCPYCLVNLMEGDYCAEGDVTGIIPDSICGPGLFCSEGQCVKMSNLADPPPCSKAQAAYDQRRQDETLGSMELRPNCDDNGFFDTYKCIPGQTCFCTDKNGNRIFGEIPFTSTANLRLKCQCSRKYYEVLKFFDRDSLHPNEHFRCTSNGDYDRIQCIGDDCMCTDALDGAPTYPTKASVNTSSISAKTLPDCFDPDVHLTGKYYYACAEKYLQVLEEINSYKKDGFDTVFEIEFPDCEIDGNYKAVQKASRINNANEEEIYYYCANPDGSPIGSYEGINQDQSMDCRCARTSLLLSEDDTEKPECCLNGNFNKVQCRRGKCYCVDADGYQDVAIPTGSDKLIEADVHEKEKLFCYDPDVQNACLGQT